MSQPPLEMIKSPAHQNHEPEVLQEKATIDYRFEFVRKAIHLCSLSIPIVYYFISREQALALLIPITFTFFIVDVVRYYHAPTAAWFYRWFGWLLRKHEADGNRKRFTGATNILLSAIACVLLFPKIITINAFAILIISDTTSALFGRRFGRRKFLNKSLEGTLAFFVSAILVVLVTPKADGLTMEYVIWIVGAAVGAITESLSGKIDDNISIPISIGLATWGLYALLLPAVDLYKLV